MNGNSRQVSEHPQEPGACELRGQGERGAGDMGDTHSAEGG